MMKHDWLKKLLSRPKATDHSTGLFTLESDRTPHASDGLSSSLVDPLLATRSPDGRVREAALHALTGQDDASQTLRAVLPRLNDWVPQVRQAARAAVDRLLPQVPPQDLLALVPDVEALRRGARADHQPVLAQVEARLLTNDPVQAVALQRWLHRRDARVAAFCFELLWRHQRLDLDALVALGQRCRHPQVARRAVQVLGDTVSPEAHAALGTVALNSRHGPVRQAAWRVLQKQVGQAPSAQQRALVQALAVQALCDSHGTVRAIAMGLFGGDRHQALDYAEALWASPEATPPQRAGALALLGDLCLPEGLALVSEGLRHPLPIVRRAAYGAAFKLRAETPQDLVLRALDDPAPSVFKTALRWAERLGVSPTAAELTPWMTGDAAEPWARCLQLLALGDPWNRLVALLSLPRVMRQAAGQADRFTALSNAWLRDMPACFMPPSVPQTARIESLLRERGPGIFDSRQQQLVYWLEGFGMTTQSTGLPPWKSDLPSQKP